MKILKIILWIAVVVVLSWMAHPSRGQGTSVVCRDGKCCPAGPNSPLRIFDLRPSRPLVPVNRPPRRAVKSHPSIARIENQIGNKTNVGTGTYVEPGVVLSCQHLFSNGVGRITVSFMDGSKHYAALQAMDSTWDLSMMTINAKPRLAVKIATVKPRVGDVITYYGLGQGRYRYQSGKLLRWTSPMGLNRFELLDVAGGSRDGDSGGPMFNAAGELVGVITGTGVNKPLTGGPNCIIISQWLKTAMCPPVAKDKPTPDDAATPGPQPTKAPPLADELEKLREQVKALTKRLADIKVVPGPAGPAGPTGLPGKDGLDGTAADYGNLPPITVQTVKDGKVIETTQVPLGGTLRLRLVPIK